MLSRRHFCCAGALVGTVATLGRAFAADDCAVPTRERQAAVKPGDALEALKAGNERVLSGHQRNCDVLGQVRAAAGGQYPFAMVIGCIDSRVSPELVFDQRIGDIFCARLAGNVIDDDVVGSAEFATKLAGAKLIVVLGHSECGAVKGAIDDVELGKLTGLLRHIRPAVDANADAPGDHTSKNRDFVQQVAVANTRLGVQALQQESQTLRDRIAQGELGIVAAMHDIASGRVTFLS